MEITEQETEVLLDILHDYPQSIKWTIKGVSLENLRNKLSSQLKEARTKNVSIAKS